MYLNKASIAEVSKFYRWMKTLNHVKYLPYICRCGANSWTMKKYRTGYFLRCQVCGTREHRGLGFVSGLSYKRGV